MSDSDETLKHQLIIIIYFFFFSLHNICSLSYLVIRAINGCPVFTPSLHMHSSELKALWAHLHNREPQKEMGKRGHCPLSYWYSFIYLFFTGMWSYDSVMLQLSLYLLPSHWCCPAIFLPARPNNLLLVTIYLWIWVHYLNIRGGSICYIFIICWGNAKPSDLFHCSRLMIFIGTNIFIEKGLDFYFSANNRIFLFEVIFLSMTIADAEKKSSHSRPEEYAQLLSLNVSLAAITCWWWCGVGRGVDCHARCEWKY